MYVLYAIGTGNNQVIRMTNQQKLEENIGFNTNAVRSHWTSESLHTVTVLDCELIIKNHIAGNIKRS